MKKKHKKPQYWCFYGILSDFYWSELSWVFFVISDGIWCYGGVYHSNRVNLGPDRGLRITADALEHSEFKFNESNLNYWTSTTEWLFRVAVRKKSAQILPLRTGVVPVAWKASSVWQIWSQMKKLIFLKKTSATRFLYSIQLSHTCFELGAVLRSHTQDSHGSEEKKWKTLILTFLCHAFWKKTVIK